MNSFNFTGNLGRDGELKYTPKGDAVIGFSVALSSGYGDKKITTWLNCSLFGKRAESLAPHLKKGSQVAISGEFQAKPYTTKDGMQKESLEVRVIDVTLIGGRSESAQLEQKSNDQSSDLSDINDDIPFN